MFTLAGFWTTPFFGIFQVWQIPLFLLMIALVVFWKIYRSKQM